MGGGGGRSLERGALIIELLRHVVIHGLIARCIGRDAPPVKYQPLGRRTVTRSGPEEATELKRLKEHEQQLLQALTESTKTEERLKLKIRALTIRSTLKTLTETKVKAKSDKNLTTIPTIFVVTPTFTRFVQKAELTRVSQALKNVRNAHWIVVEDSKTKTPLVGRFLKTSGLNFTHLNVRTPETLQRHKNEFRRMKPRGVMQRNVAITWLREHVDPRTTPGVVYFADDDNTYDSQIFEKVSSAPRGRCVIVDLGCLFLRTAPRNVQIVMYQFTVQGMMKIFQMFWLKEYSFSTHG